MAFFSLSPYVRGRQILMEWGSDEDRSSCRLSVQITVQNPEVNRNQLGSIRVVDRKAVSKIAFPYCPQESDVWRVSSYVVFVLDVGESTLPSLSQAYGTRSHTALDESFPCGN